MPTCSSGCIVRLASVMISFGADSARFGMPPERAVAVFVDRNPYEIIQTQRCAILRVDSDAYIKDRSQKFEWD